MRRSHRDHAACHDPPGQRGGAGKGHAYVINTFNGALEFLSAADLIRTYQPTSRIPNGRIWGPVPMDKHPDWQWRFVMTRDPSSPEMFSYAFDVEPIGAGDAWIGFISGSFVATGGGVRRGMGTFKIWTDDLRADGYVFDFGMDGSLLQELDVMYSTAAYPISVSMTLKLYPRAIQREFSNIATITYDYEALESGQGAMEFSGTDSTTGSSIRIVSRWLGSGRGRADATATDGNGVPRGTRTECWNDAFEETYDFTPWAPANPDLNGGDVSSCPDI